MDSQKSTDRIDELALRLAAAYISYVAGKSGEDRTLKDIRGEPAGEFWRKLAVTVMEIMAQTRSGGSDDSGGSIH